MKKAGIIILLAAVLAAGTAGYYAVTGREAVLETAAAERETGTRISARIISLTGNQMTYRKLADLTETEETKPAETAESEETKPAETAESEEPKPAETAESEEPKPAETEFAADGDAGPVSEEKGEAEPAEGSADRVKPGEGESGNGGPAERPGEEESGNGGPAERPGEEESGSGEEDTGKKRERPDKGEMSDKGEMPDKGDMPDKGEMPDKNRESRGGGPEDMVTLYIPVSIPVYTDTGTQMTYTILQAGDTITIQTEQSSDGTDVITAIWLTGTGGR